MSQIPYLSYVTSNAHTSMLHKILQNNFIVFTMYFAYICKGNIFMFTLLHKEYTNIHYIHIAVYISQIQKLLT